MKYQNITFEKKNSIAIIRLNRPKQFNSINFELEHDLIRALEICHDDDDVRVVVITGEGKAFCAGGDLNVFRKDMKSNPQDVIRQIVKVFNFIIMGIRQIPKPVIAVINGTTAGGGLSLAAACDLRIAAESAKFMPVYTRIGLVPDGAWTLLVPLLIGFGKATELVLLDPVISAREALDMGLVNRVFPDEQLWEKANEIMTYLSIGPTRAFAIAKENLNSGMMGLLHRQLELERYGMTEAAKSRDYEEGLTAFFDKRTAVFEGK